MSLSRRGFLKLLGSGLVVAAAPKIIVDMGANLWRPGRIGADLEEGLLLHDGGSLVECFRVDAELNQAYFINCFDRETRYKVGDTTKLRIEAIGMTLPGYRVVDTFGPVFRVRGL
jgi:hypothetical protein